MHNNKRQIIKKPPRTMFEMARWNTSVGSFLLMMRENCDYSNIIANNLIETNPEGFETFMPFQQDLFPYSHIRDMQNRSLILARRRCIPSDGHRVICDLGHNNTFVVLMLWLCNIMFQSQEIPYSGLIWFPFA
jgi:hypothetical protein